MTGIRRVVTGYGPDGRARVVSDDLVESTSPDYGDKWSVWAGDEPPWFPGDGAPPPFRGPLLPDPNPFGYGTVKGASALHATASADCLMQVSGESVFVLEDTEIRLRSGDWLIVNGVPLRTP